VCTSFVDRRALPADSGLAGLGVEGDAAGDVGAGAEPCSPAAATNAQFSPRRLVLHSDAGSRHTAISLTEALIEAGIAPSIGTVGDALDNALMESTIGLCKTELIDHDGDGSWTGRAEVETETASWVHWCSTTRIHHSITKMSPVELEALHARAAQEPAT